MWVRNRIIRICVSWFCLLAPLVTSQASEQQGASSDSPTQLGLDAIKKGDFKTALEQFENAVRMDPKDFRLYYHRAYARLFSHGDLDLVIDDCSKAIGLAKNPSPPLYILRSTAYRRVRDFEGARQDIATAMSLDPHDYEIRMHMGWILLDQRKLDEAIAEFSEVYKKNPRHYEALLYRGRSYAYKDDFLKSLGDLNEAIRLKPAAVEGYLFRATVLHEKGDNRDALEDCAYVLRATSVKDFDPEPRSRAHLVRGCVFHAMGKPEMAIEDFSEAIRLLPTCAQAFLERGNVFGLHGQPAKALADFKEYIRLEPTDPKGYEGRAAAYEDLGQLANSKADLRRARQLRGQN